MGQSVHFPYDDQNKKIGLIMRFLAHPLRFRRGKYYILQQKLGNSYTSYMTKDTTKYNKMQYKNCNFKKNKNMAGI